MADLILPSELEEVRRPARLAGFDPAVEIKQVFGCVPERLSRRVVPSVIEHLSAKRRAELIAAE